MEILSRRRLLQATLSTLAATQPNFLFIAADDPGWAGGL